MSATRDRVANAIRDGINGGGGLATLEQRGETTLVHVDGFAEPIVVKDDDVDLPTWAEPLAPGIRLDVQAVLAT